MNECFKTRVVLYGVGAIGSEVARLLLKRGMKIIGAIDSSPEKIGRDLGEIIGIGKKLNLKILKSIDDLNVEADIAIHATTSFLENAFPQLKALIEHDLNIISTCEELSYPYIVNEELARRIDELAKNHGVTVLGTGINPGFIMDTLVITLTAACQDINNIHVERVINAAKRRLPFQKKIGAGLKPEEFKEKISLGEISGHIGLKQSIAMIADAIGWKLDEIREDPVKPVILEKEVKSNFITVKPGFTAGLIQKAYGIISGESKITLIFKAYIGVDEEYDGITINGEPPIHMKISPCIHGDRGTAAVIVNSIPKVINAPPGLKTMKDLPAPSAFF